MVSENFPHDAAYKAFFSNPDMVKSLLLDFVPEDFVKYFDFDSLEVCSGSYISSGLQQRHDDIVWRVRWQNDWCYIYILLEFQSAQDYWMPLRILTYASLLWENLIKQGNLKIGDKLPPIFPIVIYNGEGAWKVGKNIRDLIVPLHDKLSGYQPEQKYFLIDENRISKLLLDKAKGESAYIFRLEQAKSAGEILAIAHEISKRLNEPKYDFLKRSIYSWIDRLLRKRVDKAPDQQIDTVEDTAMLEQRIAQWEEEILQKGILEGKEEGLTNQKNTLLEMLSDRFGDTLQGWEEIIDAQTDPHVLKDLIKSVWKVASKADFETLLKNSGEQ